MKFTTWLVTGLPSESCSFVVKVYGVPSRLSPDAGLRVAPAPTTATAESSSNPVKKMLSSPDGLSVFTLIEVSPLWTNGSRLYSSSSHRGGAVAQVTEVAFGSAG